MSSWKIYVCTAMSGVDQLWLQNDVPVHIVMIMMINMTLIILIIIILYIIIIT